MEEEYLVYLKENNPELYDQAISSLSWAAKWRDDKIKTLDDWNEEQAAEIARLKGLLKRAKPTSINGGKADLFLEITEALKGEPHD